jgi:hypothetical protein
MNGFVCATCGLAQGDENRNCVFCGEKLNITMQ